MANYKSRLGGTYERLDNHTATTTESSYTLTKTLDMINKYSEILIIIQMENQSAANTIGMVVNALEGTSNRSYVTKNNAGTISGSAVSDTASLIICPSYDNTKGKSIKLSLGISNGIIKYHGQLHMNEDAACSIYGHNKTAAQTEITSIKIQLSSGTWPANTLIDFYGLKRT
jgi:hypothetical protein